MSRLVRRTLVTLLLAGTASADTVVLTLDAPTLPPGLQCPGSWTESGLPLTVVPTALDDCGLSLCNLNLGASSEALVLVPARLEVDLSAVPGVVHTVEAIVSTPALGTEPLNLYDGDVLVAGQVANHTFPPDTVRVSAGGAAVDRVAWEPCLESSVFEILIHFDPLPTDVPAGPAATAIAPGLLPPRPHPLPGHGDLRFRLRRGGRAVLTVHDVTGRVVRRVAAGFRSAGTHSVSFDGRDAAGLPLPGGVYFQRLALDGGGAHTGRLVLVR